MIVTIDTCRRTVRVRDGLRGSVPVTAAVEDDLLEALGLLADTVGIDLGVVDAEIELERVAEQEA